MSCMFLLQLCSIKHWYMTRTSVLVYQIYSWDSIYSTNHESTVYWWNAYISWRMCFTTLHNCIGEVFLENKRILWSTEKEFLHHLYSKSKCCCWWVVAFMEGQIMKQYIPLKSTQFGIKSYDLCESESEYIWNAFIHIDIAMQLCEASDDLKSSRIVMILVELLRKGYCILFWLLV